MQVLGSMYRIVSIMPGGRQHNQIIHTLVSILDLAPVLIIKVQDLLFTAALIHQVVM